MNKTAYRLRISRRRRLHAVQQFAAAADYGSFDCGAANVDAQREWIFLTARTRFAGFAHSDCALYASYAILLSASSPHPKRCKCSILN